MDINSLNLKILQYKILVIGYILYKNKINGVTYKQFNLLLNILYKNLKINIIYSGIYFLVFKSENKNFNLKFSRDKIFIYINISHLKENEFKHLFKEDILQINEIILNPQKMNNLEDNYFYNIFNYAIPKN